MALTKEQTNAIVALAYKDAAEGRPWKPVARKPIGEQQAPPQKPSDPRPARCLGLNHGTIPSGGTDEEALAQFARNQRNRPLTRVGVAEQARLLLQRARQADPEKPDS